MGDAGSTVRKSTTGSAIVLLLIVVCLIAGAVYLCLNPDLLEGILYILVIAVLVIAAIIVVGYLIVAILAVPYYAMKGEETQTGATYNLDDVESVKEADSEKKE